MVHLGMDSRWSIVAVTQIRGRTDRSVNGRHRQVRLSAVLGNSWGPIGGQSWWGRRGIRVGVVVHRDVKRLLQSLAALFPPVSARNSHKTHDGDDPDEDDDCREGYDDNESCLVERWGASALSCLSCWV